MKENSSFTEEKILRLLILFALPVLLALFLQAMYGAVDLLVVGKFASATDVSAVSTGSQIMTSLTTSSAALPWGPPFFWASSWAAGKKKRPAGPWAPQS